MAVRTSVSNKATIKYSQVFNPATGHFIKRDARNGRIVAIKSDGKPFSGIELERSYVKANPNLRKSTARKAEQAVIKVRNGKAA